jgi:hypothetical protein
LKKAGWSDAIRSEAILDEGADAALGINAVGNHRQNDEEENSGNFEQRNDDERIIHRDFRYDFNGGGWSV